MRCFCSQSLHHNTNLHQRSEVATTCYLNYIICNAQRRFATTADSGSVGKPGKDSVSEQKNTDQVIFRKKEKLKLTEPVAKNLFLGKLDPVCYFIYFFLN